MDLPRKSGIYKSGIKPSGMHSKFSLDPKQFSDKSFQLNCQKEIIAYFQEKCLETPITIKHLQSPNTKDFIIILTTLVRKIDPFFELTAKIEDEVPAFFKQLGYPHTISRNSLLAVGAPNSWPALLAALYWILDFVKMYEKAEEDDVRTSLIKETSEEELYTEHFLRAYELFLQTQDYSEELAQLSEHLRLKNEELFNKITQNREIVENLKKEREEIKNYLKNARNLDSSIEFTKSKIASMKNINLLVAEVEQRKQAFDVIKNKYSEKLFIANELEAEISSLCEIVKSQKYSAKDLKRKERELQDLKAQEFKLQDELSYLRDLIEKENILLNKQIEEMKAIVNKLQTLSAGREMIAKGLLIYFVPEKLKEDNFDEVLYPLDFVQNFKELNCNIMTSLNEFIQDLQNQIDTLLHKTNEIQQELKNSYERIEEKKNELQELTQYSERGNQSMDFELEKKKQQIRQLENEIKSLKNSSFEISKTINNVTDQAKMREKEIKKAEIEWAKRTSSFKKQLFDLLEISIGMGRNFENYIQRCSSFANMNCEKIIKLVN